MKMPALTFRVCQGGPIRFCFPPNDMTTDRPQGRPALVTPGGVGFSAGCESTIRDRADEPSRENDDKLSKNNKLRRPFAFYSLIGSPCGFSSAPQLPC